MGLIRTVELLDTRLKSSILTDYKLPSTVKQPLALFKVKQEVISGGKSAKEMSPQKLDDSIDLDMENIDEDESPVLHDSALVETFLMTYIDDSGQIKFEYLSIDVSYETLKDSIEATDIKKSKQIIKSNGLYYRKNKESFKL